MPTFIYYGGSGILAHPTGQPTPNFSEVENSIRYGNRWGVTKTITLDGVLSGCTYDSIVTAKNRLEQIYTKDFQPLQIVQDGIELYRSDYNIIREINFESSRHVGILPYSVSIESYPAFLWSGTYGVLDPVNSWEFSDSDNQLTEVTHTISARGFNTSAGLANSFDNAKNYVLSLTGTSSFISPYFTKYCTGASLCLDSFSENIDRFNQTYSITEKYVPLDSYNGGAGFIRYETEFECNLEKGIASLNINGEVKSCKNADLATLRAKYQGFDVFSAAVKGYFDACGRTDLNQNFLSSGINEDPYSKKISFNVSFDNDFSPKTSFDYSTDIKIGDDDITTVEIKGTIKGRGDLQTRWAAVQDYYNNQLNLFYLASQSYTEFNNGNVIYPLNPARLKYSVSKNSFAGEIEVAAAYDNRELFSAEFNDINYTLSFNPQTNKIKSLPLLKLDSPSLCSGNYYSVFLGFTNRAAFGIKGNVIGACSGSAASTLAGIKNLANYNFSLYCPTNKVFLERNSVTNTNEGKGNNYSFDFEWSAQGDFIVNPSPYNFLDTLKLK